MIAFSTLLLINPQRYVILKTVTKGSSKINYTIWCFSGILFFMLALFLTQSIDIVSKILNIIYEITTPINLYFVPSILYLVSCYKEKSILWIIAAIFNIIVCILVLIPICLKYL